MHIVLDMRKSEGREQKTGSTERSHVPTTAPEDPRFAQTWPEKVPGSDPYNSGPATAAAVHGHTHRDSEDMATMAAQQTPIPAPASDLSLRLAGLRVELERLLSDMESICAPAAGAADRASLRLIQKLRESARHLEDAIDSLLPPDDP